MCLPEVDSPADVMDEISGWSEQSVGQFSRKSGEGDACIRLGLHLFQIDLNHRLEVLACGHLV